MATGRQSGLYMVDEAWDFLDELYNDPENAKRKRGRGSFVAEMLLKEKAKKDKKKALESEQKTA